MAIAPITQLRPYQTEAIERTTRAFQTYNRVLLVMATGTGKTVVFVRIGQLMRPYGRILVVAHREELLIQAAKKFAAITGMKTGIEQGSKRVNRRVLPDVVCASVQSIANRLGDFDREAFSLIINDEAHHSVAHTYQAVHAHFETARVLGVTATPDRMDGRTLGTLYEHCAFSYDLPTAVREGWLVPLHGLQIHIDGLNFEQVRTTAGDLNERDLDKILNVESILHAMARAIIEHATERKTIIFCVTVGHAEHLAAVLNEYRPGRAVSIDGSMGKRKRAEILAGYANGETQFLCNCALLTEGIDIPDISCIVMARPTLSRGLYSQALGRGTRQAPGKDDSLVLDFAGNSGRHQLIAPIDIVAPEIEEKIKIRAQEIVERTGIPYHVALVQAEAEENGQDIRSLQEAAQQAAAAQADDLSERLDDETANHTQAALFADMRTALLGNQQAALKREERDMRVVELDLFDFFGIEDSGNVFGVQDPPAYLVTWLRQRGVAAEGLNWRQCLELQQAARERTQDGLCTFKQARILARFGIEGVRGLAYERAKQLLDHIAAAKWRPSADLVEELKRMARIDAEAA